MKITWYGHAAFRVESGGAAILIDPFFTGNPSWSGGWERPAEGVTHVLLTHGHNDHVGDSLAILKKSGAMLVANPEICDYLSGKGMGEGKVNPGNHGGTVECGGFTVTFVDAKHSSASTTDNGGNVYLGNPNGLVLHFPDDKTLYAMGDTDMFGDMALIQELHEPQVALVPVGDRFTMGGAVAALACRRFFRLEAAVPCHYGSFPVIERSPQKFLQGMKGSETRVVVLQVGETREF